MTEDRIVTDLNDENTPPHAVPRAPLGILSAVPEASGRDLLPCATRPSGPPTRGNAGGFPRPRPPG